MHGHPHNLQLNESKHKIVKELTSASNAKVLHLTWPQKASRCWRMVWSWRTSTPMKVTMRRRRLGWNLTCWVPAMCCFKWRGCIHPVQWLKPQPSPRWWRNRPGFGGYNAALDSPITRGENCIATESTRFHSCLGKTLGWITGQILLHCATCTPACTFRCISLYSQVPIYMHMHACSPAPLWLKCPGNEAFKQPIVVMFLLLSLGHSHYCWSTIFLVASTMLPVM